MKQPRDHFKEEVGERIVALKQRLRDEGRDEDASTIGIMCAELDLRLTGRSMCGPRDDEGQAWCEPREKWEAWNEV